MGVGMAFSHTPAPMGATMAFTPTPTPMGAGVAFTLPRCLADRGGLHPLPQRARGRAPTPGSGDGHKGRPAAGGVGAGSMGGCPGHPPRSWLQVLGREGPFPLILLPQFGGYWIEGTNHQVSGAPASPPAAAPSTRAKLEGNHTAKIYRKHFLGKVSPRGCSGRGCSGWGGLSVGPRVWARRPGKCGCSWTWLPHGLCLWVLGGLGAVWVWVSRAAEAPAPWYGCSWTWVPHGHGCSCIWVLMGMWVLYSVGA